MSDHVDHTQTQDSATPSRRGQSLVEFALVLPMLIVLLLGIVDFGRVFHAGITVEAASRDAAEVAAQEYLQLWRNNAPIDYPALHRIAAKVACEETQSLPEATFAADTTGSGGTCPSMPIIRVCIHDDQFADNTICGQSTPDFAPSVPAECTQLQGDGNPSTFDDPAWTPAMMGDNGASRYVEVRVCYRFSTMFNLNMSLPMNTGLSLGSVWLQQRSTFTVADY